MDQPIATELVLACLGLLAICVTVASMIILTGGKLYRKIPEKSRPRRWVVGIFFSFFVTFCLWCAAWSFYPRSIVAYVSSYMFGAFGVLIAAWIALGRVGSILSLIIVLVLRIIDACRADTVARRR